MTGFYEIPRSSRGMTGFYEIPRSRRGMTRRKFVGMAGSVTLEMTEKPSIEMTEKTVLK